jgi:cell division protein FtsL
MGTPFFQLYNLEQLAVSPQLWIYALISIPLTAVTLIYWRWQLRKRIRERSKMSGHDLADREPPV